MLQVQLVHEILPYHQLMTPKWLHKHAIINGNYTIYPHYLEIQPTTITGKPKYQLALEVKLVAPYILKITDYVTVTVTIALDTELANAGDHDPSFGISDGKSFVGFTAYDKSNYNNHSPCRHVEGETIDGLLKNFVHKKGPYVTSDSYSSEIKLQFRPAENWASCHTEHNEGYVNIAHYHHYLDITNGLYLQMYHEDDPEKYRIKYIAVDVHVD